MTPCNMAAAGIPKLGQFVSWEATSSLHAHSEDGFGAAGPPCAAIFGPSVEECLQPNRTQGRQEWLGAWLDPRPGQEEGVGRGAGLTLGT